MQSPLITCFLGMATPGLAASKKRSGRYASGTTAAANPATFPSSIPMDCYLFAQGLRPTSITERGVDLASAACLRSHGRFEVARATWRPRVPSYVADAAGQAGLPPVPADHAQRF